MSTQVNATPALTMLSEDEQMFRDALRDYASGEVMARVEAMEQQGHYDKELLDSLFEMGLMGIEIPEAFGGAGGTFFQAILAVEELSRADAAVGVLVDVHNTLFNTGLLRWGTDEQKTKYLPLQIR